MKAGVLPLPHDPPSRLVDRARLVEAAGYDHLWLADERFFREVLRLSESAVEEATPR